MFTSLPKTAPDLLQWSWPQIEPYFQNLTTRELTSDTVVGWLTDWSSLRECLSEMYKRLFVATTLNTADAEAERRFNTYLEDIFPVALAAEQRLKEKLLASRPQVEGFEIPLRNMRAEDALFREANLPLLAQDHQLSAEYAKITGAQTVTWDGEEVPLAQLQPVYQDSDRGLRERAWRLTSERQLADREAINELWQRLLSLRRQLATNADLGDDYRAYRWQQLLRFDYTPANCAQFQQAIEQVVVPAATRLYEKRRQRLGVDMLRPWDLNVDPLGHPPLRPFTDVAELEAKTSSIFHRIDPQLGAYFDVMVEEKLMDLENRKNKAPGAYCEAFDVARRPFVFLNAVGLHDDVQTLLHEGGHAFHVFESNHLPYHHQLDVPMEFAEVASMSMELLAAPYLTATEGGFYSQADAARARAKYLEDMLLFWPYMAVVDAFQHWVYQNADAALDPTHCDAQWTALWKRFMPGVDWSGLEPDMMTGWHRKLHIHQIPFYYVEYGLAQLGAVQIWRNALRDQAGTVADYRRSLALGGTVPLPQLYETAGAKFAFDADTLHDAVKLVEETIATLDPQ
ncbi:MAG: M3 family oligoendopeptidase [Chloroflexi bacterium]|nr:M3 family oligoendopeptidase [Chloroflexota bacterium]